MHKGTLMKYIFMILVVWSGSSLAIELEDEDCGPWNRYEGKVFSLEVGTSFHGSVTFKLCKSEEQNFLSVKTRHIVLENENRGGTETIVRQYINISKDEYQKIFKHYEKALAYNTLDNVSGLDGSTWCIETQRSFTYSKACFWTPSHNPDARGLEGLYSLGNYLWQFSGLDKDNRFKLY